MLLSHLKNRLLAAIAFSLLLSQLAFCVPQGAAAAQVAFSNQIIDRYVRATDDPTCCEPSGSIQVDINASLPRLNKKGHLRALKIISSVGHSTYRVLSFQGDATIKKDVIARYLQVDQNTHESRNFAIIPANYKFKFKGKREANLSREVYVFEVSPRRKRTGLFKGELWLDAETYLPVYERGRFVKNPSVFFKKVDFERAFRIQGGVSVPEHISSTIDARIVGRVELTVAYSNFSPDTVQGQENNYTPAMAEASE